MVGGRSALIGLLVLQSAAAAVGGQELALELEWYHPGGGDHIGEKGFIVSDLDGDGVDEIVAAALSQQEINTSWYVYRWDGETYQQEFAAPPELTPVSAMAIAQADADAASEVLVSRGAIVGVWDGIDHRRERTIDTHFAFGIQGLGLADVDGDGRLELVAATEDEVLALLDQFPASDELRDLAVGDMDGEGLPEIIYVAGDTVYILDAASGVTEWEVFVPGSAAVDVGQTDDDPQMEVAWSGGFGSRIYVGDTAAAEVEWQSLAYSAVDAGFAVGALTEAEPAKILLAVGQVELSSGFMVFDAASRHLEHFDQRQDYDQGTARVALGQLDGDSAREILFGTRTDTNGHPTIMCLDGETFDIQWQHEIPADIFGALLAGDVDGDGHQEVVAAMRSLSGGSLPFVEVVDGETGALEWRSPQLGENPGEPLFLRVGDVDVDAAPEIVVATRYGALFVLSADTQSVDLETADLDIHGLDLADLSGNSKEEIVIGDGAGDLAVVDSRTGGIAQVLASFPTAVDTLNFYDFSGDSSLDAVLSANGGLLIYDLAGERVLAAAEQPLEAVADLQRVEDLDGDGIPEILVLSDSDGLFVFRVGAGSDIFADGFESGDTAAWDQAVP